MISELVNGMIRRTVRGTYIPSRPMPRARNHINALAEQHDRQLQKIAELEKLIAEVRTRLFTIQCGPLTIS
jgi:hypothetical protein